MSNKIIYIDLQQAIKLHNLIIDRASELPKTQDCSHLENILQQIKSDNYSEFKDKLTYLIFAINEVNASPVLQGRGTVHQSQKFIEDSKRLSIVLGCYFLELNGYDYVVHYFAKEMENIVVWLADKRININLLYKIIESLIYEEDFSEELKLNIAIAIS